MDVDVLHDEREVAVAMLVAMQVAMQDVATHVALVRVADVVADLVVIFVACWQRFAACLAAATNVAVDATTAAEQPLTAVAVATKSI